MMENSFWTKNLTETLLRYLTEQHDRHGEFDHGEIAKKMTAGLNLPFVLEKRHIVQHLEVMFTKFFEEKRKQDDSKWIWMEQLQQLYNIVQKEESRKKEIKVENTTVLHHTNQVTSARPVVLNNRMFDSFKKDDTNTKVPVLKEVVKQSTDNSKKLDIKIGVKVPQSTQVSRNIQSIQRIEPQIHRLITTPIQPTISTSQKPMILITKKNVAGEQILIPLSTNGLGSNVTPVVTTSTITLIPTVSTLPPTMTHADKIIIKGNYNKPIDKVNKFPVEGKQRIMPLQHVEYLLDIYSQYLNKRMLESGRLSKGTFNEIASDMNSKFKVTYYERDQITSKLQNLKSQFKNRKLTETNETNIKLQEKIKAIVELESKLREQAESDLQSKNEVPRKKYKVCKTNLQTTESASVSSAAKASVITSTPNYVKIPNYSNVNNAVAPDYIKREDDFDPLIESQEMKPTLKEKTKNHSLISRNTKKMRLNSFIMDEAMSSLLEMSKSSHTVQTKNRLREKREELEKLRLISFNMFKSITEVLRSLDD